MNIEVLASSSSGNAYIVDDGDTALLLDAGITLKEMQIKSSFRVNRVTACLLSHEHGDHSKGVKELLKRAVDIYAPPDTITALNLSGHRVHQAEASKVFTVGSFKILPVQMFHDCDCYGYLIHSQSTKERLFFATDTYKITVNPKNIDYLIVEVNYQMEIINRYVNDGIVEPSIRSRLLQSHFELSDALAWLNRIDKSKLKRIYIAHLSSGNSNAEEIKRAVIETTGIPVTICEA